MSRAAARFTEADAARAIKAAKRCGAASVEIKPDGSILVHLSPQTTADAPAESPVKPPPVEPKPKVVL